MRLPPEGEGTMDRTREHRQSWSTHSCGQYEQGWAMRGLAGGALAASLVLTVSVQRSAAAGTKRTGGEYEEDRLWARRCGAARHCGRYSDDCASLGRDCVSLGRAH